MIEPEDKRVTDRFRSGLGDNIQEQSPELVSVIIPAFNAATNIRRALNSVRVQTYQTFEVIVVDDGSADGTSDIVEEFVRADSRFRLVRQENRGVGDARNVGIRSARGKYIAPLDADDFGIRRSLRSRLLASPKTVLRPGWCTAGPTCSTNVAN